jgi:hypothetical protein
MPCSAGFAWLAWFGLHTNSGVGAIYWPHCRGAPVCGAGVFCARGGRHGLNRIKVFLAKTETTFAIYSDLGLKPFRPRSYAPMAGSVWQ